jgi:hypothetical protein
MWSWLEIAPQHVFTNSLGEKEQMSVGVAQNAVSNRLGSMSEERSLGRSFHAGKWEGSPGAVNWGYNFAEQFERAIHEDPRLIFITGWNEWIAARFPEFNGIRKPVMFVDEFDEEQSRDIEPMKGGHGDDYYYQLAAFVRRYKGVRALLKSSGPKTISPSGDFEQWNSVLPEYRDDVGDTVHRDFPEYGKHGRYVNTSGRNDIILAKVATDSTNVYFYARTREPLSPHNGTNWMWLLIDSDNSSKTGWEGYDLILNHEPAEGSGFASIQRNDGGAWKWAREKDGPMRVGEKEIQLAVPRALFPKNQPLQFHFKWADNMPDNGDIVSWLDGGDAAPNGRFSYSFVESQ